MVSRTHLFALSVFALLIVTGCETKEVTNTKPSPEASSVVKAKGDKEKTDTQELTSAISKIDIAGLLDNLANIKKASEAGDFAKAREEFKAFDNSWKQQKNSIKTNSPDTFKAIKDSKDEVKKALKEEKPTKDKVLTALQTLEQQLSEIKESLLKLKN